MGSDLYMASQQERNHHFGTLMRHAQNMLRVIEERIEKDTNGTVIEAEGFRQFLKSVIQYNK